MISFLIICFIIIVFCIKLEILCYKKCPPSKAMVVYSKVDNSMSAPTVVTSGGVIMSPMFQDCEYFSLEPMAIHIDTANVYNEGLLTKNGKKVNIIANGSVAISKQYYLLKTAVKLLHGFSHKAIEKFAQNIILGEIRLIVSDLTLKEVYDGFEEKILKPSIKTAMKNVGMELFGFNIEEITELSESNEAEEKISAPDNSFSEEFKQIAKSETENQNEAEQNEIKSENKSSQKFSFNYNDFSDENIYLEIENAVTKNYEEISLAPQFQVSFPKEVMEEYLGSKEFNEQIKNILTEKTKYVVSAFYFEEIQNNEKEFLKELLKEVNNELNSFELNVKEIKLLGLFNVSEYMKTLDEEDKENNIELTEEISVVQEVSETQEIQDVQKETELLKPQISNVYQSDTQTQMDDIFASTRKYFEKNNGT